MTRMGIAFIQVRWLFMPAAHGVQFKKRSISIYLPFVSHIPDRPRIVLIAPTTQRQPNGFRLSFFLGLHTVATLSTPGRPFYAVVATRYVLHGFFDLEKIVLTVSRRISQYRAALSPLGVSPKSSTWPSSRRVNRERTARSQINRCSEKFLL
jgi:hypothetical protein